MSRDVFAEAVEILSRVWSKVGALAEKGILCDGLELDTMHRRTWARLLSEV